VSNEIDVIKTILRKSKAKLVHRMVFILRQLSIFLIGNTFISLHYIHDDVPNLGEFSVEPERQYFPLVGFALRGGDRSLLFECKIV